MAYQDLSFSFGETLIASKMTFIQSNFTALAADEAGAPTFLSRATCLVTFDSTGVIQAGRGVTSITHGGTGIYTLNPTTVFSVGQQIPTDPNYGTGQLRSVMSTVVMGFNVNIAYSDPSVRVLAGAYATETSSATFPMNFQAMNNSAKAMENVELGHVAIVEHT